MDGEEARLESLERRINRIERRLEQVQAAIDGRVAQASPDVVAHPAAEIIARPAPEVVVHPRPVAPPPAPAAAPSASTAADETIRPAALDAWSVHEAAPVPSAPTPAETPGPAWSAASAPPETARPRLRLPSAPLKDLEEQFAGRALAWIGGLALVAAAVFFLSLAFSRGWITEPMRVLIGLVVGSAAFAGGAAMLARRSPLVGNVLAGVGLGILSITLMAATRLYNLIPPELGLAMALVMAVAAAFVAIRFDARSVAAFGLVAALAAPPLTGAAASTLTLLFVAVTLVGTTAVALYRSWRWLPSLAFLLAAPQLASWLLDVPPASQALIALAGFWAVNLVAAAGEEVRVRRDDLRPSSTILVLANATFLLWGLSAVLEGDLEMWRGLAIAIAAIAHLLAGLWFLVRQGWQHLFGNLFAGTGVALVAIATFVQLGAPAVPVAWAAEAVALAWLAARRVHRWSALAALVLGGLAVGHLLLLEYPLYEVGLPSPGIPMPMLGHVEAASLGGVLVALGAAIVLVPVRWTRSALAAIALLLVAYAAPFEVAGNLLVAVLAATAVAGLLADRLLERSRTPARLRPVEAWTRVPWASCTAPVAGALALIVALPVGMPSQDWLLGWSGPILEQPALGAVIVLLGLLGAAALVAVRWLRSGLGAVAVLVIAWTAAFQVDGTGLVAVLAVLLPVAVLVDRGLARLRGDDRYPDLVRAPVFATSASVAGAVSWVVGTAYTVVAWPLDPSPTLPAVPFTDERTVAVVLLAASAVAAARWLGAAWPAVVARLAAIGVVAWLIPSEVGPSWVVILWVALAGVALVLCERDRADGFMYGIAAGVLWALALVVGGLVVATPDHLWVSAGSVALEGPWMAAFAMLAAGLVAGARSTFGREARLPLLTGAGLVGLYAVSIAVVDLFTRRVGGGVAVEELAKQAQVALSVCWTAIGVSLLGIGLWRGIPMLRHAGFGLLGAAIAKVVIIDMASMDVAYRALVLFGLGLLLLAGAWLLSRFRGPRAGTPPTAGQAHPA